MKSFSSQRSIIAPLGAPPVLVVLVRRMVSLATPPVDVVIPATTDPRMTPGTLLRHGPMKAGTSVIVCFRLTAPGDHVVYQLNPKCTKTDWHKFGHRSTGSMVEKNRRRQQTLAWTNPTPVGPKKILRA